MKAVLPFVLGAYLETQKILNPQGLVTRALDRSGRRASDQAEEAIVMLKKVKNLSASFENGRLTVHVDKTMTLELVEAELQRFYARDEAGTTSTLRPDSISAKKNEFDGELRLPSRSIYVKFVPRGTPLAEFAVSCLPRALRLNPSELWLLTVTEDQLNLRFDPVFREKGIVRGGLRTLSLTNLFRDLVGRDYDVSATQEDGGFKLLISRIQKTLPEAR